MQNLVILQPIILCYMTNNPLLQFGNVPVESKTIEACYNNLKAPKKKVQALEKAGEIVRLRRGLYVVNPELSGKFIESYLCANHIYGPSYISLHWALWWYGLIPEMVFTMTSTTTKRSRLFETSYGWFEYCQVSPDYYNIGIREVLDNNTPILIATPEKALCDFILKDKYVPSQSVKSLIQYLDEDIRFYMDAFLEFDVNIVEECARQGRKTAIFKNLIKIIESWEQTYFPVEL